MWLLKSKTKFTFIKSNYKEQLKKQSITYLDDFLLSNVVFLEIDTNTLTKLKNNQDLNVRLQQTAKLM